MASGTSGTAGSRNCVGCGRPIPFDANVCPYCGHDYRVAPTVAMAQSQTSEGVKILLYILSFLIPIVGFIIGVIYYTKPDPDSKNIGKMCLILALVGILVGVICNIAWIGAFWV